MSLEGILENRLPRSRNREPEKLKCGEYNSVAECRDVISHDLRFEQTDEHRV